MLELNWSVTRVQEHHPEQDLHLLLTFEVFRPEMWQRIDYCGYIVTAWFSVSKRKSPFVRR